MKGKRFMNAGTINRLKADAEDLNGRYLDGFRYAAVEVLITSAALCVYFYRIFRSVSDLYRFVRRRPA